MSFISRFFSGSKDENLPGLAELLEARGVAPQALNFDENFFRDFDSLKASERATVADAIASLVAQGLPMPPPWSEAQYELLPKIIPTWQGERDPYYYHPCFDKLSKMLLASGQPVPPEWFVIWDIGEDEAMDIATDHLEELSKEKPFVRLSTGIYRSDFGDGIDSSRVLLAHHWNQLFPGQNTFIAIPTVDTLLVAPQILLPKLAEAIGESVSNSMKETGQDLLAVTMYQWVDGKLMPASLQEPHPMIQPQREFRQMDTVAAYNAQTEPLAKMQIGEPCSLGLIKTQQGRTLTLTTWIEGRPAIIPDSDLLAFMSAKGRPLGLYWRQTIPRLNRIKGVHVDIWGPRRLLFSEFPNAEEMEQLECFAPSDVHAQLLDPKATRQQNRPPQSQQNHAASASASSNSPVPAHLRGLSLGVQGDTQD